MESLNETLAETTRATGGRRFPGSFNATVSSLGSRYSGGRGSGKRGSFRARGLNGEEPWRGR